MKENRFNLIIIGLLLASAFFSCKKTETITQTVDGRIRATEIRYPFFNYNTNANDYHSDKIYYNDKNEIRRIEFSEYDYSFDFIYNYLDNDNYNLTRIRTDNGSSYIDTVYYEYRFNNNTVTEKNYQKIYATGFDSIIYKLNTSGKIEERYSLSYSSSSGDLMYGYKYIYKWNNNDLTGYDYYNWDVDSFKYSSSTNYINTTTLKPYTYPTNKRILNSFPKTLYFTDYDFDISINSYNYPDTIQMKNRISIGEALFYRTAYVYEFY